VCGHDDPEGTQRRCEQDQGKPLAGKSTLNRLELSGGSQNDLRYKKIVARPEAMEEFFIGEFVRSLDKKTRRIVLDLDLTEDPLYGQQEGRFFHGYYDSYCYLPLYIFCGDWPVVARLRTSDQDHFEDTVRTVAKVVQAVRAKFPRIKIVVRADSGFCRDALMSWCEAHEVQYVLGLGRNPVLQRILRGSLRSAKSMLDFNQSKAERVFKNFSYRAKTWAKPKRRVVGKAEWTQEGANPRFIITNIPSDEIQGRELYEREYCGRGEMENRIKEQHLDLRADRTSTHFLASNQLRLWFSTLAYLLLNQLRQRALVGTELAQATCGTIRLKLMKIGAIVKVSVRRVLVSLSANHPMKELWFAVARKLFTMDTT
jgi:Transposase DDE domain group 1